MRTVIVDGTKIKIPVALDTDHTGSGSCIEDTVGEAVSIGDILYIKSDGKWWKADAKSATTMPGAGLATEAKGANLDCGILLGGPSFFRDDSWTYTAGSILFVSVTPGPPTQISPSGSGDQVQVIGIAKTATVILFNPSYEMAEVE